jgi:menaquinone-9 beta-reductase
VNDVDIAIVGGGPAGAALAIRLADAGRDVALFERLPQPRWRAAGVYSSPLTRRRLAALGLSREELDRLIRPISIMVVRTVDGSAECRLDYAPPLSACGVDRVRLERSLLDRAMDAGAQVHEGSAVTGVDLAQDHAQITVHGPTSPQLVRARLVVGADGPASVVARAAGVALASRRFRRAALTVHRADPTAAPAREPMTAELIIGRGWYCGVAPVPGQRVNLGLVMGEAALRRELANGGDPGDVLERRLAELRGSHHAWQASPATDTIQACLPLLHRVRRATGRNFLLVGDAAGFIDPVSGEGLHRALVSVDLAAEAIGDWCAGRTPALEHYGRQLRARFAGKDTLSWMLQLFLTEPRLAGHALRNLARSDDLRRIFARSLADLAPPSRVIDPRFLVRVLARG